MYSVEDIRGFVFSDHGSVLGEVKASEIERVVTKKIGPLSFKRILKWPKVALSALPEVSCLLAAALLVGLCVLVNVTRVPLLVAIPAIVLTFSAVYALLGAISYKIDKRREFKRLASTSRNIYRYSRLFQTHPVAAQILSNAQKEILRAAELVKSRTGETQSLADSLEAGLEVFTSMMNTAEMLDEYDSSNEAHKDALRELLQSCDEIHLLAENMVKATGKSVESRVAALAQSREVLKLRNSFLKEDSEQEILGQQSAVKGFKDLRH